VKVGEKNESKGEKVMKTKSVIFMIMVSILAIASSGETDTGPAISTQGYSIFDETIVDMKWPQVEKAAQDGAIVLFPTGVIEEHGPHMGLGVDAYMAYLKCKLVRRKLESRGIQTIIAPPFYWGINNNTGAFPGSFTVRKETMKAVLYDTMASFRRWGFQYLFIINHHGDTEHNLTILDAVKEARIDTGINAYYVLSEFEAKVRYRLTGREPHVILIPTPVTQERPQYLDVHAGTGETGMMVYYFPEQVDVELAKALKSTNLTTRELLEWDQSWSDARRITPLGYFGDPSSFDPEVSHQRIESSVEGMTNLIESFMKKKMGDRNKP
jgi:creatinine amidohydrolase